MVYLLTFGCFLMVHVSKYTIHGSYGIWYAIQFLLKYFRMAVLLFICSKIWSIELHLSYIMANVVGTYSIRGA